MDVNEVVMARYGRKLNQDGAAVHINLLETSLALYKPLGSKNEGLGVQGIGVRRSRPKDLRMSFVRWRSSLMVSPN